MKQNEPMRTTGRRRTGWWILGSLFVIAVLAPQLVISLWGATLVSGALSRELEKPVTIQQMSGGWWAPLEIGGLTISDGFEANSKILLRVSRINLAGPVWMLAVPGTAIDVAIHELRLELRRLPNGQWNIGSLQPDRDTELPDQLPLFAGKLNVHLMNGQVYLEPEDRTYSLTAKADSLALREQRLQWSIELSSSNGESLTARGSFGNLSEPRQLTGSAKVELVRLDLAMIPALVPRLPVMYPDGTVEAGNLEVSLAGLDQFQATGAFDLRDISLPDLGDKTDTNLARASIRIAVTRNRDRWTVETLALEGPHGRIALEPGAWVEFGEKTWRGKLELRGELDDTQPASRALAMLLPDPLDLAGTLSITARVGGTLSLDSREDLGQRLANVKTSFDLRLAQANWREAELKNLIAQGTLESGRLTVSALGASIGAGRVSVQGDLAFGGHSGGISWIVSDVPLGKALAPPLETFDITKATGRLTFDGETYVLESHTQVREFNIDPAALDNRTLRINDAQLDCAGTLTRRLTRFNMTSCQLTAVQGDLSSRSGQIDLGSETQLTVDLQGWLGGPFLTALVPELKPRWPARIQLNGHLMVPFTDEPWFNMQWQLNAAGQAFTYEGVELNNLRARVTKSVGRLDLDISGERGKGSLAATGSLQLGEKDLTTLDIKAARLPVHRQLPGPYMLEATVSGTANVTIDAEGEHATVDNHITGVKLRRSQTVVANLESAALKAHLTRTRSGGLGVNNLTLAGQQLNLRIYDSYLPQTGLDKEAFKLNADFEGSGSWLTLAAALGGADYVVAGGDSRMSLQVQAKPGRELSSLLGKGNLKVARLSLWGHPLSSADAVFELHPQEIKLTRALVRYGRGQVALEGNIIFPFERADPKGHLVLRLEKVPVTHTQAFASFRGQGPATLTNETVIDGHIALDGNPDGQLAVTADIKTGPISRGLSGAKDLAADLPPMHFESKLLSRTPLQDWTASTFELRGQGVSIKMTDGRFLRQASGSDISGVIAIDISPEFVQAASLGLLPPEIKPTGNIAASGRAKLHLPQGRAVGAEDMEFDGTVKSEKFVINADELHALRLALRLAGGRLEVEEGEASLLGGRVWLPGSSFIELKGEAHDFNVNVAAQDLKLTTYGARQVSLGRFLGLLLPVFLFTSRSDKPVSVSGVLQSELQLTGTYRDVADWSRSVNGKGSFRIDHGSIVGSTVVSGFIARALLMPTNVVHNAIAALFSRDGDVGRALTGLGARAFTFRTIESPITIREGEISLRKDLKVSSPEMTLTINGHSNLEGQLDYDIGTDLIRRVRLGEITDLPNRIPIIGRAIRFLNPFTYLDGIELRAKVTGNLLKTGSNGQPDVHVATSVLDAKRS